MAETKNQHIESDSFSQDDVDQLLQSESHQEAEEKEEIDNLLRNISLEESAIDPDVNGFPGDEISPGDIRSLLSISLEDISVDELEAELLQAQNQHDSAASLFEDQVPETTYSEKKSPKPAAEKKKEAVKPEAAIQSDGSGVFSQDDIEKLLSGESLADPTKAEAKPLPATESDDAGGISQDDIDKLLFGELAADPVKTDAKPIPATESDDSGGGISQEDIDNLLADDGGSDDPVPKESESQSFDEPSQEEERSLFISQNELNLLLEEYKNKPSNKNTKTKNEVTASLNEEPVIEDPENLISQNEIDMLLSPDPDDKKEGPAESEEGLISQEDIDSLLQGKDDNPEEAEDDSSSLISQQDIDILLKGADDNDSSGEPTETDPIDKDDNESGLVSQEDIDSLLKDQTDQDDEPNHTEPQIELDRVVLEEADDIKIAPDAPPPPEIKKTGKKKWYRSRLIIACLAGAIVFLISSVSLYFFLSRDHAETAKLEITSIESESKDTKLVGEAAIPSGLSIDFNEFIVLDPRNRDDIAFLKADIQITCNNTNALRTITSRKPFFRFMIYDVIQKTLEKLELPEKENKPSSEKPKDEISQSKNHNSLLIDQTKLQITIRQSLENSLSKNDIKEIVLKNINLF